VHDVEYVSLQSYQGRANRRERGHVSRLREMMNTWSVREILEGNKGVEGWIILKWDYECEGSIWIYLVCSCEHDNES
jgi:hypothetical protein